MTEQKILRAEILLGQRDCFSDGSLIGCYDEYRGKWSDGTPFFEMRWIIQRTYGLIIDGEQAGSSWKTMSVSPEIEIARSFVKEMRKRGVSDYTLVNGERIRATTGKRVRTWEIYPEQLKAFKRTLETALQE